jgi:hypothetical protein
MLQEGKGLRVVVDLTKQDKSEAIAILEGQPLCVHARGHSDSALPRFRPSRSRYQEDPESQCGRH